MEGLIMINIDKPDLIVLIKNLKRPIEISKMLQQIGAAQYSYAFKHKGKVIKIGMSADNSKIYGERAYRQIANLPGWPTMPISSCGKDILAAVKFFEEKENVTVHKDDCSLEIWIAATKASSTEDTLLTQYENTHGCLPPGNPKDTRPAFLKSKVRKDVFANLFEIE